MVNIGRNEVAEFYYASSLAATGEPIVAAYSTVAANSGKRKRIRVTDIKLSAKGTASAVEIGGLGFNRTFKPINVDIQANTTADFSFTVPYPVDTVASTGVTNGEVRMIYASAAEYGVKAVITGYFDVNEL